MIKVLVVRKVQRVNTGKGKVNYGVGGLEEGVKYKYLRVVMSAEEEVTHRLHEGEENMEDAE